MIGTGWGFPQKARVGVFAANAADVMAKAIDDFLVCGSMRNYWAMEDAVKAYGIARQNNLARVDL